MTLENPYKETSKRQMLAYELGMEDYYDGANDDEGPFEDTELHDIWLEGWQAAKHDDEHT